MAAANPSAGAPKAAQNLNFNEQPVALKIFILVFAITFVAVVYYFAFHMGLSDDIEAAERRHGELLTQRSAAERRQQEFVELSQQVVEREPIDRRNRRILPENPEIPSFLGDMNRLAELSGLSIQTVQPQPEAPEELYVRIPVRMTFRGRFHQFAKFFHAVSQLERAVNLQDLDVELSSGAGPGRPSSAAAPGTDSIPEVPLTVELLASTFRRPRQDEAAAATATGGATP